MPSNGAPTLPAFFFTNSQIKWKQKRQKSTNEVGIFHRSIAIFIVDITERWYTASWVVSHSHISGQILIQMYRLFCCRNAPRCLFQVTDACEHHQPFKSLCDYQRCSILAFCIGHKVHVHRKRRYHWMKNWREEGAKATPVTLSVLASKSCRLRAHSTYVICRNPLLEKVLMSS